MDSMSIQFHTIIIILISSSILYTPCAGWARA